MRKCENLFSMLAAAGVTLSTAASAFAAGAETDIYGGRGGGTWDWDGAFKIVNLRTVAWDQMCNAEGIYAFVQIHDWAGTTEVGRVEDEGGCSGGHEEHNGYWENTRGRIEGVTVKLCRDSDGDDECVGTYYDNPNN